MIRRHLLPLTKINENGQYVLVQPILIFFAERCIYHLLTTNLVRLVAGQGMEKMIRLVLSPYRPYLPYLPYKFSLSLHSLPHHTQPDAKAHGEVVELFAE